MSEPVDVLVMEDSAEDVELMLRALKKARLVNPVHVVGDGAEAPESFFGAEADRAGRLPRVVLLDPKLPRVGGFEVLVRLKSDERTRSVPVVVLMSSQEGPDVQKAYELGANSYIVKPVESEGFAEAVIQAGLYWLLLNEPRS